MVLSLGANAEYASLGSAGAADRKRDGDHQQGLFGGSGRVAYDRTLASSFQPVAIIVIKSGWSSAICSPICSIKQEDGVVDAAFFPAMTPLAALLMQDNWKAQMLRRGRRGASADPSRYASEHSQWLNQT